MTADLVARLEATADGWPSRFTVDRAHIALLREAASALRSSGEADDIDDDQSCATGGPEWQRGFEAGRVQGRREVPATPASASVSNEDIHLAAQMLTWGMQEGLTSKQYDEVIAHQRKLLAATTPPTSTKGG